MTQYFDIPVQNRGDNLKITGNWKVVVRYSYIDVGQGSLSNPLVIAPETLQKFYVTSKGFNTIDQETGLFLSFKPVNPIPATSNKGRIRVVLPN